jgi:hypothetical protein
MKTTIRLAASIGVASTGAVDAVDGKVALVLEPHAYGLSD